MSLLQTIHQGKKHSPPRIVLYGTEGIGKSTTAAQAPNPIFIPTEDGLDQIACDSFPLAQNLNDVLNALSALRQDKHDYQSVVIDSLDWLERLIWDELCQQYGVNSIEKVDGGYARGYTHALTHWRRVLNDLNDLRNNLGMCVILLAHAKVEKFEDPEHTAYDRYSPRLHKHANALITEWADGPVCDAHDHYQDRGCRIQPFPHYGGRARQGWRRAHYAMCRLTRLRGQEPLRPACGALPQLAGPHRCNDPASKLKSRRLIYGESQQL